MSQRTTPAATAAKTIEPAPRRMPFLRRLLKPIMAAYLRPYHKLDGRGLDNLPPRGPAIILLNHASLLDVPSLMVLDPYPDTATVVKSSMFRMPLIGWVLRQWGAVPVDREGRDTTSVRRILEVLREGRVLAVAAEGRRTRSGHLEAINPVLARIAAGSGVPLVPVGITGSYEALPPGAILPRPVKIVVRVGKPFYLERGTDAATAAAWIQHEIAALLPPEMQPVA